MQIKGSLTDQNGPTTKQYWRPYICILESCKLFLVDKAALHDSYGVNHWKHISELRSNHRNAMLFFTETMRCKPSFNSVHVSEHILVYQPGSSFRGLLMSGFKPDLLISTYFWQKMGAIYIGLFFSFPLLF